MSQNKPFPLTARVPIGRDAQGRPVAPSEDFVRLWDAVFKRVGEYKALTNIELEELINQMSDHGALEGLADDDHPQYHNDARGDARYSQLGHSHAYSSLTGVPPAGEVVATVPANSFEHSQTIAAPGLLASHRVSLSVAHHSDSDENSEEMLSITCMSATAGADTLTVYLSFTEPHSGPIRLNYQAS